jgi:cell wall-associated NlpC family hydrolase
MTRFHKFILSFLLLYIFQPCFSQEQNTGVDSLKIKADSVKIASKIKLENSDSISFYAQVFLGTPYKYAGNSPKTGFDCSGFVNFVFRKYNISLPRSSKDFDKIGIEISADSCLPGDIVLFSRTLSNKTLTGHVGIVIGKDENSFQFIHATTRKGIIIDDYKKSKYFFERFRGIRRVLKTEKSG